MAASSPATCVPRWQAGFADTVMCGCELALDGIGAPAGLGSGVVVFPFLPRRLAPLDPMLAHEPLDAVAADLDPAPAQRDVQLAVAVALEVLGGGRADRRDKPRHGSARGDRRPVDRRLWARWPASRRP